MESEQCCSGACIDCSTRVPSSIVLENTDIDEEEETSWTVWETINTKMVLQTVSDLWLLFFVKWMSDGQFFCIMPKSTVSNVNILQLFVNTLVLMIMSLSKLNSLKIINLSGSENHKVLIGIQIKPHSSQYI